MSSEKKHVAIIGAGFSGIMVSTSLKQLGHGDKYTIIDSESKMGGTWQKNYYPGIACDTPAPAYEMSEFPNQKWSQMRPKGHEIRQYLEDVATDQGLIPNVKFNTYVESCVWNEDTHMWDLKMRSVKGDGKYYTESYSHVVSAVGQLNIPKIPNFKNLSDFKGRVVHTAEWDRKLDLRGKRVGIIGAGPTCIQICTPLAEIEGVSLKLFQRTVPYMNPFHYEIYDEKQQKAHQADPTILGKVRKKQVDDMEEDHKPIFCTEASEEKRKECLEFIHKNLPKDMWEQVTPDYPYGTKRICYSPMDENGSCWYFETIKRDNVSIVRSKLDQMESNGIRTKDGELHELDVILMATGYKSTNFLDNLDVTGATGQTLKDRWNGEPRAFYGMQVPDFPNFYMMYGPGTNLGHSTVLYNMEASGKYIAKAIDLALSGGHTRLEVTKEAFGEYMDEYISLIKKSVWNTKGVTNWYKTASGVVVNQSPWRTDEYARRVSEPKPQWLKLSSKKNELDEAKQNGVYQAS